MIKFLSRLISVILRPFNKLQRRAMRVEVESWFYGYQARHTAKHVGKGTIFHNRTRVTSATYIGEGCGIGGIAVFGGGEVTIADHAFISGRTTIYSQNHNYDTDDFIPFGWTWTYKPVRIDSGAWIGDACIILPGTHIGEGAIIQAGAVVHGEIPPMAIAGGNPAKVFAKRNQEHYEKLKREGRYVRM